MPRLGIGTWRMGESVGARRDEIRAVRHAIKSGIAMIDTAEMYGDGGAEEAVVIPKSSRVEGIDEIAGAANVTLTHEDRDELKRAFAKPPASARMETT